MVGSARIMCGDDLTPEQLDDVSVTLARYRRSRGTCAKGLTTDIRVLDRAARVSCAPDVKPAHDFAAVRSS
jgi:hypothetical protein